MAVAHKTEAGALSVAAVLVALGRERALKLLARFEPEEVEFLGKKAGALGSVDREKLNALTYTFERDFAAGTGLLNGGRSFGSILEETRTGTDEDAGPQESNPAKSTADQPPDPWEPIAAIPADDLAVFLKREGIALSALTAAQLDTSAASALLAAFDTAHRANVMAAMASAKPSEIAIETALDVLCNAFDLNGENSGDREAETRLAAMLSSLEPDEAKSTLDNMRAIMEPDAIARITAQILRFDDIATFDLSTRTALAESCDREQIAIALADSPQTLRDCLLEPMGQRARRMVESAIPPEGTANPDKRNAARQDILATIRKLAEDGTITLPVNED